MGVKKTFRATLLALATLPTLILFSACLKGPGLFKKDGDATANYTMVASETDGIVTGKFDASSSANQFLSASGDIAGAGVMFPPGALSIDSDITIEQGSSLASNGFATALGLGTSVVSRSNAVVISSSLQVDASSSFTVSIPVSGGSLALADVFERVVVIYKVYKAETKSYAMGVIPRDDVSIVNGVASFKTRFFGAYQVAETDEVVSKAVESDATTPILTKAEEAKLPEVVWTIGKPSFSKSTREAKVSVSVSGLKDVDQCTAFVHQDRQEKWIDSEFTRKRDDIDRLVNKGDDYHYRVTTTEAMTLYFRFECTDARGFTSLSPFTQALSVPKKTTDETAPITLSFNATYASATSRVVANTLTLRGTCDASMGDIGFRVDELSLATQVLTCQADNKFSIPIGRAAVDCTGGVALCLEGKSPGGYGIYLSQGSSRARTVVFKLPDSSVNLVTADTGATLKAAIEAATAAQLIVLTKDLDLTGSVWAKGAENAVVYFDGDFHTIKNLNLSTSGASTIENHGLIATLGNGGRVGHLTLDTPSATFSNSGGSSINKFGFVVGAANCATSDCSLVGIDVKDAAIGRDSTQAGTMIGGIVGYAGARSHMDDVVINGININLPGHQNVGSAVGQTLGSMSHIFVNNPTIVAMQSIGGLAGAAESTTTKTFRHIRVMGFTGTASDTGTAMLGGIVGNNYGSTAITTARVTAVLSASKSGSFVGGVAGKSKASLTDIEVTAHITGGNKTGGIVGGLSSGATAALSSIRAEIILEEPGTYFAYLIGEFDAGTTASGITLLNSSYLVASGGTLVSTPTKLARSSSASGTMSGVFYDSSVLVNYCLNTNAINTSVCQSQNTASLTFPSSSNWAGGHLIVE